MADVRQFLKMPPGYCVNHVQIACFLFFSNLSTSENQIELLKFFFQLLSDLCGYKAIVETEKFAVLKKTIFKKTTSALEEKQDGQV